MFKMLRMIYVNHNRIYIRCLHDRKLPSVIYNNENIKSNPIGKNSPNKYNFNLGVANEMDTNEMDTNEMGANEMGANEIECISSNFTTKKTQ